MVVAIDVPAALEALDDAGGGGIGGADEKNWATSGEEAVDLAGNDRATAAFTLGHEADVTCCKTMAETVALDVWAEFDRGDAVGLAEAAELLPASAAPDEEEAEAIVIAQIEHGGGKGIEIVSEAEIAGVEQDEPTGVTGAGKRLDGGGVGPVVGDVDTTWVEATLHEAFLHALAKGDNSIGTTPGKVGEQAGGSVSETACFEVVEVDGDIGVDVHLPDEVSRSTQGANQGAEKREEWRRGQGEDKVRAGQGEAAYCSGDVEREIGQYATDPAANEGQRFYAVDLYGGRVARVGDGIATIGGDRVDGVTLGGEATREISEQLAGGCRVGPEKLVEEKDSQRAASKCGTVAWAGRSTRFFRNTAGLPT